MFASKDVKTSKQLLSLHIACFHVLLFRAGAGVCPCRVLALAHTILRVCCAETLFNMKFASKQLSRMSKKCEKKEAAMKKKTADALRKGNTAVAKEYASSAIREKGQALSLLKLSSRLDAVAARVETAIRMNNLTKAMGSIVSGMDSVLETMDITKLAKVTERFETQFDTLDVRSGYMEDAIDSTTALSTPDDQVQSLMQEVAAQNGLEIAVEMDALGPVGTASAAAATPAGQGRVAVAAAAAPTSSQGAGGGSGGGGDGPPAGGGGGGGMSDFEARLAALRK